MILRLCMALAVLVWAGMAAGQDKRFGLHAPERLVETGILDHLLPRFSLKTGVQVTVNGEGPEARFTEGSGVPVMQGPDILWHFDPAGNAHANRFLEWLTSEIGARAIAAYQPDGDSLFVPAVAEQAAAGPVIPDADTAAGERLSLALCGRCHVVDETNRMKAIGSTPSFAVLRTLPGWLERFEGFYVLKPHGAFTQVEGVTPPFDPARPSPIVPVELTLDDLDAILAYVATVAPADLGAPIQSQ